MANAKKKTIWMIATEIEGDRAGGFRQSRWVKIFLKNGYSVEVINYSQSGKFRIFSFCSEFDLQKFRDAALNKTYSKSGVRQGKLNNFLRGLKHFLFLEFFNIGAIRTFLYLRKRINSGDVLMSSAPPIVSCLIGYFVKRENNKIVFVNDLRDAWAMHGSIGGVVRIKKMIERRILTIADVNITVSEFLKDQYETAYSLTNFHKAYNMPDYLSQVQENNHISIPNVYVPSSEYKSIVYTGSLPHNHFDLKAFVNAVKKLILSQSFPYRFLFFGNCVELSRLIEHDPDLQSYFYFVSHIPNSDVIKIQNSADILLFFGYNAPENGGVVSTKLFEYLHTNKPILPVNVQEYSDVSSILEEFCGRNLYLQTEDEIFEAFKNLSVLKLPYYSADRQLLIDKLSINYNDIAKICC